MRKPVRALVLLCAVLLSSLAGAQTQPRTWRLDFYETGGPGIEAYSFDRLVVEPLAWPDNPAAERRHAADRQLPLRDRRRRQA